MACANASLVHHVESEEAASRGTGAGRGARPVVGQHVDDDVDPGAVEAPRLEREPLDPEMAARVAVDAEHGAMSGPPMAPPERDAGVVDREGGLGEDRHERALEP